MLDGTEREVPTSEELAALSSKATQFESIQTEYEKTKKELEQAENPNWKQLRTLADGYKEKLKAKGFNFDESGQVIEPQAPQITQDQIQQEARSAAKSFIVENEVNKALEKYEPNTREVVRKYYEKLSSGEQVDSSNFSSLLTAAVNAAGVGSDNRQSGLVGGGSPAMPKQAEVDRAKGIELAKEMGYQFKGDTKDILSK